MMDEFGIIKKYFRPLTMGRDELLDDTAVLPPRRAGEDLVITSDSVVEGVHFLSNASPADIAHKVLRRNLSDLAASGAEPLCYQLNLVFPEKPKHTWLAAFRGALLKDQKKFGLYCSGGDTSGASGRLFVSITAIGVVPARKVLRRSSAKPGDHVILTGPVGDAFIGLQMLQKKIKPVYEGYFINAYYKPMPRTENVATIRKYASAAIDISDGLVADLGHICEASKCGAEISLVPGIFSDKAKRVGLKPSKLLTGGDDYELALAVRPRHSAPLLKALKAQGLKPVKIGEFTKRAGVRVLDQTGRKIDLKNTGWRHF
ncbi:MAG: thiamine-phosphate kinase [Alphaproteobacteria bacterium]|nr:thiamine-phosphate kinase [Alphaproteobacteria bacterium]